MARAFSAEPSTPSLKASTAMSSSRRRACSATDAASSARRRDTPRVSCTVNPVSTDSGWQPRAAMVSTSACSPAPPVGSEAAKVSTTGSADDMG